jgi:hypothetical protein
MIKGAILGKIISKVTGRGNANQTTNRRRPPRR